jgi:cytochrome c oxidase cbb3-type subunit 3
MRKSLLLLFFMTLAAIAACDRPPSAENLPEWTPKDHDRVEESAKQKARGTLDASSPEALVEATWRSQCATCHGAQGRGDGPTGPMVKATDLSNAEWQGKTSDADIAAVIKNGKGKMPKFDLPDPVLQGIVARVRSFKAQ